MKCIKGGKIITSKEILENKILVFDSKIVGIFDENYNTSGMEVINAQGNFVCPGFISTHIHGCLDNDVEDGKTDSLEKMSQHLLSTGVTSWCPTLCTVKKEQMEKVLNAVRQVKAQNNSSEIIGLYLEGIYLSSAKKGAHREDLLSLPDSDFIIKNKDIIKIVICAPELDGAVDFAKAVSKEGVVVSVGHSNATYKQTKEMLDAGATNTTHLFNACSPLNHRDTGLPGAVLSEDTVYTELICDNFHISSVLYDIVYKLKGDKLIFITDSIRPAGMPDGSYIQGGLHVTKKGVECKLDDGVIAGSVIDLNEGINNVYKNSSIPLYDIINAISLNPAKMLNIDSEKGSLDKGKDADIVIANDNFDIIKVIKKGV